VTKTYRTPEHRSNPWRRPRPAWCGGSGRRSRDP
jgi:hypothetical protein